MKIRVFVDEDHQVYNQEEVNHYANEAIEDSDKEMINYFMDDIDTDDLNPLFRVLRDCDSEGFLKISKEFRIFLAFSKDNYINENFYESYVEV